MLSGILTIVSLVLKLFGLCEHAEGFRAKAQAARRAKAVADTPVTDKEWTDAAEKGDL